MVVIRAVAELMNRNEPPILDGLWAQRRSSNCEDVFLGVTGRSGDRRRAITLWVGQALAFLALLAALSACQQGPFTDYPDLRTIETPKDPASPLEERRAILRDLVKDRDHARHRRSVVRHRSGLSDIPPAAAPTLTEDRAGEIVRDLPTNEQTPELTAENDANRAFQDRTQFDDGTLSDFIRRMKNETAPFIVEEFPNEVRPEGEGLSDQELPTTEDTDKPEVQSWRVIGEPLVLAAFAPAVLRQEPTVTAIRLAASEPGFFCSYLGWMVAWSSACLDEESASSSSDDSVADVEDGQTAEPTSPPEGEQVAKDPASTSGGAAGSNPSSPAAGSEKVESEDIDGGEGLGITSSFDRLVNLLRADRQPEDRSPRARKSLSYEAETLQEPIEDRPRLPKSRPDVEKDLRIVRNDIVFNFDRTPVPAFKPVQREPKTVIFPPERPKRVSEQTSMVGETTAAETETQKAEVQKSDEQQAKAQESDAQETETQTTEVQKTETEEPETKSQKEVELAARDLEEAKKDVTDKEPPAPTVDLAKNQDPSLLDRELINYPPESIALPDGLEERLEGMLADAKANGGKLFIISQAAVGSLAMERARGVGLALVRLGATADLIEYDILVNRQADQVELLLKAENNSEE